MYPKKEIKFINKIKHLLSNNKVEIFKLPEEFIDIELAPSAVLIPLYYDNNEWKIIFTKRTEYVRTHKGQISFPGGKVDDTDKAFKAAALREAWEETGIKPENVEILGEVSSYATPVGYQIYPYVGVVGDYPENKSKCEVYSIILIPLEHLVKEENFEIRLHTRDGFNYKLPYFYYNEHTVWGATGQILKDFVDRIRELF